MLKRFVFGFVLMFVFPCVALSYAEEQLSNLEINQYGQTFVEDGFADRLNRLEMDMLGMRQSGDIDNRIGRLNRVSFGEINTPSFDYYKPEKRSAIKNLWDNVSSVFDAGYMTGFIPSFGNSYGTNYYQNKIQDYCPYHNSYNNSYHHRPARFNHYNPRMGYNPYGPSYQRPTYGYSNTTTGSSVHILRDWFYTIKKRTV